MTSMHRMRWTLISSMLVGVLVLACLLLEHGPHATFWPKCLFHQYTGLHCAGCGMTRASHALLQGDPITAFRYNPLVMGLFALGLLAAIWELVARVSGKDLPFRIRPRLAMVWVLIGLFLAFWVLRNIPAWPFTLLAPP